MGPSAGRTGSEGGPGDSGGLGGPGEEANEEGRRTL